MWSPLEAVLGVLSFLALLSWFIEYNRRKRLETLLTLAPRYYYIGPYDLEGSPTFPDTGYYVEWHGRVIGPLGNNRLTEQAVQHLVGLLTSSRRLP